MNINITKYSSRNNNKQNLSKRINTVRSVTSNSTNKTYLAHPSQQSDYRPPKSTIKVGYSIIPSTIIQPRKTKKKVQIHNTNQNHQNRRKNMGKSQNQSGKFQAQQYMPRQSLKSNNYLRRSVQNARQKYYNSKQIQDQLKPQINVNKRQSRRSTSTQISSNYTSNSIRVLPSYNQTGIKDILQYQHAGKYRDIKVTQKCTNSTSAQQKFVKFNDLHQYDFRKRPQHFR